MTTLRIFDVGGFVRDEILGVPSKDRDCTVVIEDGPENMTVEWAFQFMHDTLEAQGFKIFVSTPEHVTVRALPAGRAGLTADFVLARREGPYSDGRRPDWVEIGTLADDLARRDFTMNALARDCVTGELIDNHGGIADLQAGVLRFVGDPMQRITEDALRVMRGLRFMVTRQFTPAPETIAAICDPSVPALLARISEERRELEIRKMFEGCDTVTVTRMLGFLLPQKLVEAMFAGRVRLTSTLKG